MIAIVDYGMGNLRSVQKAVERVGFGATLIHSPQECCIPQVSFMYFVHSYYVCPEDPGVMAATTDYGTTFASFIWKDNLFATQFHPEKSQGVGLSILRNFAAL